MGIIISIDIGGSATKIVGADGSQFLKKMLITPENQADAAYDGIDKFLNEYRYRISDISAIYMTGVGSSYIDEQIHGIETIKIQEFDAIGNGALRLSGLGEALAVSMGTGTAFVRATAGKNVHIGGTGIGGGTIQGLASQLSCRGDINEILEFAQSGDIKKVDLMVGDIAKTGTETLALELTASNFGKLKDIASGPDTALGLINMVFETIGVMALFALRNDNIRDIVLTGTLAVFPQARVIFDKFSLISDKRFIIPENAQFATAIGMLPREVLYK